MIKKRGRPKGSKNKLKPIKVPKEYVAQIEKAKPSNNAFQLLIDVKTFIQYLSSTYDLTQEEAKSILRLVAD